MAGDRSWRGPQSFGPHDGERDVMPDGGPNSFGADSGRNPRDNDEDQCNWFHDDTPFDDVEHD
jgi:hypothetical protein